ncbi:hypothetical protein [Natronincola peptidivorans]|uniref:hypothetical protein n=1 Tax=Natronincola peptidivorans TaxID=426128 RepID=UPI0011146C20|nr:hypothetical protein [Natronincola peptidivorans]
MGASCLTTRTLLEGAEKLNFNAPTSYNNALPAPLCYDPNLFDGRQAPPRSIPLGSSSKASAMRDVSAPSKAWHFLQGGSPCWARSNQPPIPSVAPKLVTVR